MFVRKVFVRKGGGLRRWSSASSADRRRGRRSHPESIRTGSSRPEVESSYAPRSSPLSPTDASSILRLLKSATAKRQELELLGRSLPESSCTAILFKRS